MSCVQQQGLAAPQLCRNLVKICFRKETGIIILRNTNLTHYECLDYYANRLQLAQVRIEAQTPFSCRMQWTPCSLLQLSIHVWFSLCVLYCPIITGIRVFIVHSIANFPAAVAHNLFIQISYTIDERCEGFTNKAQQSSTIKFACTTHLCPMLGQLQSKAQAK